MRKVRIQIERPQWSGGSPVIGVAEYRIASADMVEVEIMYIRKKDGKRSWPNLFQMTVEKLRTYPSQIVGGGVKLFKAPLGDWKEVANV